VYLVLQLLPSSGSLSFYFVSSLAEMHLIKNGALRKCS